MEMSEGAEDVSTVMSQVLNRMERIVEHLRDKGENHAANSIAQNTIATVKIFNDTIAPWDFAAATMRQILPADEPPASSQTNRDTKDCDSVTNPNPVTWAAVAAVAPPGGNKIIKFTPSDTVQIRIRDQEQAPLPISEPLPGKRVLWVRGWSSEKSMSEVTNRVGQGPVYSMAFSEKDSAVCIIFQSASSATALLADDQQYRRQSGHSRFGPGCDVAEGLPFADNGDIQRMSPPLNERRRLTFARAQLFTHGMTEDRFRQDIFSVVGRPNVELVWLFNSGNATVVFSAVPLARLVRNEFIKMAKNPGSPYHGVSISFSHDPCERPMTLITQMQTGRSSRPATMYGRSSGILAGMITKGAPIGRRNTIHEADGWQTVSRRR